MSSEIATGTCLGPYEILAPIGAGGMGEVFRARDPRLERDVAVKILPASLAHDPRFRARFEREAKTISQLNHPHICQIYDVGEASSPLPAGEGSGARVPSAESGSVSYLVMELLEGESLADRLSRGALPLPDVLRYGAQIGDALAAAHRAGIVHRDLKPGNIMITPSGAKLLDFGVARQFGPDELSDSSVTQQQLTRQGASVGTPAYMSPEQMRGESLTSTSDVWSFGCLLYEMLTGKRAFDGASVYEIAAAVQTSQPEWSALPADLPRQVRVVIEQCLNRNPHDRPSDLRDVARELSTAATPSPQTLPRATPVSIAIASAMTAAAVLVVAVLYVRRPAVPAPQPSGTPDRFTLRQLTTDVGIEEFPAFSRDGSQIVYSSAVGPIRKLFRRRIGAAEPDQLTRGLSDDLHPVWSADGRRILFVRSRESSKRLEPSDVFGAYERGDVWTLDLASEKESLLLRDASYPAVSPDGKHIAVDAAWGGPRRIWLVDERGRNAQQLTSDASDASVHIAPRWSPDGKRIVFQQMERTRFDIRSIDVTTKEITRVTDDLHQDINPVWSYDGRHVYFSSYRGGGVNLWRVAMSRNGTPRGMPEQITSGAGQDVQIAIDPRGKQIAFATLRQNADLWVLDLDNSGTAAEPRPLIATTREDSRGAWSADGRRVAFNSDRTGEMNVWVAQADGSAARQLTRGPGGDYQPVWSPGGGTIAFFSSRAGNADIWVVDTATGKLRQLTRSPALDINPAFSGDGTRIAYVSDHGGSLEVWVMMSDGSNARQLSDTGVSGHFVIWTADGAVLYRCPCGGENALMRVDASTGKSENVIALPAGAGAHLSLSPDGKSVTDVVGHQVLWRYALDTAKATKVFDIEGGEVRIDYPTLSPDGRRVLFDRFRPEGGDLWLASAE